MPEFDDPEIKDKQRYVQENYSTLKDSHESAVGQFKTAIPLPNDQLGVVVMSRSATEYPLAETLMSKEKGYLEYLESSGFSSISPLKTYGEVFKVEDTGNEYP